MFWHKVCSGLLGAVVVVAAGTAAQAQIFSNSSGYNNANAHGLGCCASKTGVGRYSEAVVSRAAQLNQALTAAQQAVVDAEYRTSSKYNSIQRYGRRPAPDENCPPSAAALADLERARAALAQAQAESNSFLQSVKNPSTEQIQQTNALCSTCGKGW